MRIALELGEKPYGRMKARRRDPQLEDVRSILLDVCEAIAPRALFRISGFGQDPWPVDVFTDLAVFLEQLPSLLRAVRRRTAAELDFYEQGIERQIRFEPEGPRCRMTCTSRTSWRPRPDVTWVEWHDVADQLERVKAAFIDALTDTAPGLLSHPWIEAWRA